MLQCVWLLLLAAVHAAPRYCPLTVDPLAWNAVERRPIVAWEPDDPAKLEIQLRKCHNGRGMGQLN